MIDLVSPSQKAVSPTPKRFTNTAAGEIVAKSIRKNFFSTGRSIGSSLKTSWEMWEKSQAELRPKHEDQVDYDNILGPATPTVVRQNRLFRDSGIAYFRKLIDYDLPEDLLAACLGL